MSIFARNRGLVKDINLETQTGDSTGNVVTNDSVGQEALVEAKPLDDIALESNTEATQELQNQEGGEGSTQELKEDASQEEGKVVQEETQVDATAPVQEETQVEAQTEVQTEEQVAEQVLDQVEDQAKKPVEVHEETQTEQTEVQQADETAELPSQDATQVETQEVAQETLQTDASVASIGSSVTTDLNLSNQSADNTVSSINLKGHGTVMQYEQIRTHDLRVDEFRTGLASLKMLMAFQQVAEEHNLSAPLVAAFRATPGFLQAARSFPDTSNFNIVPEHKSSPASLLGLESFGEAQASETDVVKSNAAGVVSAFAEFLSVLGSTAANLSAQVTESKAAIESSDMTDEVLGTLSVNTVSDNAFVTMLGKLAEQLRAVDHFSADELMAHPEKVRDEVDGLAELVAELGGMLGVKITEYGLANTDKDSAYIPTSGDFAGKGITRSALIFYLAKADEILNVLSVLASHKDEIIASLENALAQTPATAESTDVVYGSIDHLTLLVSHTVLVAKLIREAIVVVSMLLSTMDSVLNVDDGFAD